MSDCNCKSLQVCAVPGCWNCWSWAAAPALLACCSEQSGVRDGQCMLCGALLSASFTCMACRNMRERHQGHLGMLYVAECVQAQPDCTRRSCTCVAAPALYLASLACVCTRLSGQLSMFSFLRCHLGGSGAGVMDTPDGLGSVIHFAMRCLCFWGLALVGYICVCAVMLWELPDWVLLRNTPCVRVWYAAHWLATAQRVVMQVSVAAAAARLCACLRRPWLCVFRSFFCRSSTAAEHHCCPAAMRLTARREVS